MQKIMAYIFIVLIISAISLSCLAFSTWKNKDNIEFLRSYGWEVKKKPLEKIDVIIPKEFDEVYENYNKIQLEAGLNLENYKGKKGTRYTYEVTNYPENLSDTVRANIIIIDNTPVAGDIMTTNINGFMHSLYLNDK